MDLESVPFFETEITTHPSLSPRGLRTLVCVICAFFSLTTLRFLVVGAWPVIVFNALEIGGAILLLRLHARRSCARETIILSEDGLHVVRTDSRGRRHDRKLASKWIKVVLQDRPGCAPALLLRGDGREEEVGAFLGEDARRELAAALAEALHRRSHPTFDNPQLRDG